MLYILILGLLTQKTQEWTVTSSEVSVTMNSIHIGNMGPPLQGYTCPFRREMCNY